MFLLQQGWGMLNMIGSFMENHKNSGVIIGPRICKKEQLDKYLPQFKKVSNSTIVFDPQFFEPRTDMDRILSYPYFNNFNFKTSTFKPEDFCADVIKYQTEVLDLQNIILPGRFTNGINEQWLEMHHAFSKIGNEIANTKTVFSTIALGPDAILNSEAFNSLIDEVINYPVKGIYMVFENRSKSYFLDEEMLYTLLDAILSLSLSGKKIILGFAHQQFLSFYAAGLDILASGNWRNVRAFDLQNFSQQDNENLRKAIWYFDGNTLGEYRIPALSLAFKRGLGHLFGPTTEYTKELLSNSNRGTVRWPQNEAFLHYLDLMHTYCNFFSSKPKKLRANAVLTFFKQRAAVIKELNDNGFSFGDRGFDSACDCTLAAINAFVTNRKDQIAQLA